MITHEMTRFKSNGRQYVASWIQITILGRVFIFSHKVVMV